MEYIAYTLITGIILLVLVVMSRQIKVWRIKSKDGKFQEMMHENAMRKYKERMDR